MIETLTDSDRKLLLMLVDENPLAQAAAEAAIMEQPGVVIILLYKLIKTYLKP